MLLEIETWLNLITNNECIDTLNILHVENVEECLFFFLVFLVCCVKFHPFTLYCVEHVYSCEGIGSAEFYSPEWKPNQGYVFSS